jgi:hypothetical protein
VPEAFIISQDGCAKCSLPDPGRREKGGMTKPPSGDEAEEKTTIPEARGAHPVSAAHGVADEGHGFAGRSKNSPSPPDGSLMLTDPAGVGLG